jgi:Fatty acid desaturase
MLVKVQPLPRRQENYFEPDRVTVRRALPASARAGRTGLLRHCPWDGLLILLALAQGWVLAYMPSLPLMAVGVWWNSNTIAHNFLHLPFFRSRILNGLFSAYQSVLLGIPQRLWRDRHLAHHAERRWRLRLSRPLVIESLLVAVLWVSLARLVPRFFWTTYLPGWLLGLALCQLQGYYEHTRGTTSHYGWVYNFLLFNDGYHVEHHARPQVHWRSLPCQPQRDARSSRWPACLRWLELVDLEHLEKLVLRSALLQQWVLGAHERAVRKLLPEFKHVSVQMPSISARSPAAQRTLALLLNAINASS